MKKKLLRVAAVVMALGMCTSLIPVSAAEDTGNADAEEAYVQLAAETESVPEINGTDVTGAEILAVPEAEVQFVPETNETDTEDLSYSASENDAVPESDELGDTVPESNEPDDLEIQEASGTPELTDEAGIELTEISLQESPEDLDPEGLFSITFEDEPEEEIQLYTNEDFFVYPAVGTVDWENAPGIAIVQTRYGGNLNLSVAIETDDYENISYTWYRLDGTTETLIPDETSNVLRLYNITSDGFYYCIAQDIYGHSGTASFDIEVVSDNEFQASAVGETTITVPRGGTAQLSVSVSGHDTSRVTYYWMKFYEEMEDWDGLGWESEPTQVISNIQKNEQYCCFVQDGYLNQERIYFNIVVDNSSPEENFSVYPTSGIVDGTMPGRATVYTPMNGDTYLSVGVDAEDWSNISFTWYNVANDNETVVSEEADYLNVDNITSNCFYYCIVEDGNGHSGRAEFSIEILTAADNQFQATAVGGTTVNVPRGESAELSISVSGLDTSRVTYYWSKYYEEMEDWDGLPYNSDSCYYVENVQKNEQYRCRIMDGYGNDVYIDFNIVMENVFHAYAVSGQVYGNNSEYSNVMVLPHDSAILIVAVEGENTNNVTYTWYDNTDTIIPGETTDRLELSDVSSAGSYRCVAQNENGESSEVVFYINVQNLIRVYGAGTDPDSPDNTTYITVEPHASTSLVVAVKAYDKTGLTYTWYDSEFEGNIIPGETTNTLNLSDITSNCSYMCVVGDIYGNSRSTAFYITVQQETFNNNFHAYAASGNVNPDFSDAESTVNVSLNGTTTLVVGVSGNDTEDVNYSWENMSTLESLDGETTNILVLQNVTSSDVYSCTARDKYGNVGVVNFSIRIDTHLRAHVAGKTVNNAELYMVEGDSIQLEVAAESDEEISYEWYRIENYTDYILQNSVGPVCTANLGGLDYVQYRCQVSDNYNTEYIYFYIYRTEDTQNFHAYAGGTYNEYSGHVYLAPGGSTTLRVDVTAADMSDITYRWKTYGEYYDTETETSMTGWYVIDGADGPAYDITNIVQYTRYECEVSDSVSGITKSIMFHVYVDNQFDAFSTVGTPGMEWTAVDAPANGDVSLIVGVSGLDTTGVTYQWFEEDGFDIAGATSNTLELHNVKRTGQYSCYVTDKYGNSENVSFYVRVTNHFEAYASGTNSAIAAVSAFYDSKKLLYVDVISDDPEGITYNWKYRILVDGGDGTYYEVHSVNNADGPCCETDNITEEITYICDVRDAYGHSVEVKFNINVENWPIQDISENIISNVTLYDEQSVFLRFIPSETSTYTFISSAGLTDTYAYLYDSNLTLLAKNDDGENDLNFSITSDLIAGETYYLKVRFLSGYSHDIPVSVSRTGHSYASEVVTPATCTTDGVMRYYCTDPGCEDSYTEVIPATGHAYELVEWFWEYDYSAASATFVCANDDTHVTTIDATISTETVEATDDTPGRIIYTASVVFEGTEYTDEKSVTIYPEHSLHVYATTGEISPENDAYSYFGVFPHDSISLSVGVDTEDTEGLTYTWYDPHGDIVSGATSGTLALPDVVLSGYYRCVVQNDNGDSGEVLFRVYVTNLISVFGANNEDPDAPSDESYVRIAPNESAQLVIGVKAYEKEGLTYTWYNDAYEGERLAETSDTLYLSNVTNECTYRCEVTDPYGNRGFMKFYVLIKSTPVVDNQFHAYAASGNVYHEMDDTESTFSVSPNGTAELIVGVRGNDTDGVTYTWYDDDMETGGIIDGETSDRLTLENVTSDGDYYCVARDKYGNSSTVFFYVRLTNHLQAFVAGKTVSNAEIYLLSNSSTTLGVDVTADNMEVVSYSWKRYDTNTDWWTTVEDATGQSCEATIGDSDIQYMCVVSDIYGSRTSVYFNLHISDTENNFRVYAGGTYNEYSGHVYLAPGGNTTLKVDVTATDISGITYCWKTYGEYYNTETETSMTGWYVIDGADASTYDVTNLTKYSRYECEVYDSVSGITKSIMFHVYVDNQFDAFLINGTSGLGEWGISAPANGDVSLIVGVSGLDTTGVTYQWFGEDGFDIEGATSNTLELHNVKRGCAYTCNVRDKYGNSKSLYIIVNVTNRFEAYAAGTEELFAGKSVFYGSSTLLGVDVITDDEEGITYSWSKRWRYYDEEDESYYYRTTVVENATGPTCQTDNITDMTTYYCQVQDAYGHSETISFSINVMNPEGELLTLTEDQNPVVSFVTDGAYKYLVFVPSATGTYTFASLGQRVDTYAYLYNANFDLLAQNDDRAEDLNFTITWDLIAGETYYIAVRLLSGATKDVPISVTQTEIVIPTYTVTIAADEGCEVSVVADYTEDGGGTIIESGDAVEENTVLTVNVAAKTGYTLVDPSQSTYTITVTDDVNITAASERITYSLALNHENGAEPTFTGTDSLDAVPYGTTVTVTAGAANDGYEFIGWYQTNGKLLTSETSYHIALYSSMTIEARYQLLSGVVTFVANDKIQSTITGNSITESDFPAEPSAMYGYEFKGWDKTVEEINTALSSGENITVTALFETIQKTITVTIYNGDSETPQIQNLTESQYVSVTAEEVEGKVFAYWEQDDSIRSYRKNSAFKINDDSTLRAVYTTEAVEAVGTANINTATYNNDTKKLTFVSYLTIPDNAIITMAGLVAASGTSTNYTPGTELSFDNADYVKSISKAVGTSIPWTYTWTKTNVNIGDTWYAKPYIVYTYNGDTQTVYGEMVTIHAGCDYDSSEKATAVIRSAEYDSVNSKAIFVAYLTVPDGGTIIKTGLVAAPGTTFNSLSTILTWDTATYQKEVAAAVGTSIPWTYTWSKTKVQPGDVWYVRPYIIYSDVNGLEHTVYGELVEFIA